MGAIGNWTNWLDRALGLFLKPECPLCQRAAEVHLCRDCQRRIQRCGFADPGQFWHGSLPLFAWGRYEGSLKRAIAAMKLDDKPHPELAQPLGQWLGQAWLASPVSKQYRPAIVPIPMYAEKRQQRGFDQAELIARSFCQVTGLPLRERGLERTRATQAQFGLSAAERERNIAGAFDLGRDFRRRPPRRSVLLLDDIYTTGSTCRQAVATLKRHRIKTVGVVAISTTRS
jgi:ComF family protein